jgi:hypothetical protein
MKEVVGVLALVFGLTSAAEAQAPSARDTPAVSEPDPKSEPLKSEETGTRHPSGGAPDRGPHGAKAPESTHETEQSPNTKTQR